MSAPHLPVLSRAKRRFGFNLPSFLALPASVIFYAVIAVLFGLQLLKAMLQSPRPSPINQA